MAFMVMFLLSEGWVNGRWIRSIWNEWFSASYPSVEWWKGFPDKAMNLLVHTSLGDIFLVMLTMMLFLSEGWVDGGWIRSIGNEWFGASHSGVEWWKGLPDESVNFLVHSSLGDILLVVLVMMLLFSEGWVNCRWIRTIGNEWFSASHSGVEWWKGLPDESMNLFIHTSLGDVSLMVLMSLIV